MFMKQFTKLHIVLTIFIFSSSAIFSENTNEYTQSQKGKSIIYFYRTKTFMGSMASLLIYINDVNIGYLNNNEFFNYIIDKGDHVIKIKSSIYSEQTKELKCNFKSDEQYFIALGFKKSGGKTLSDAIYIKKVQESIAKKSLSKCKNTNSRDNIKSILLGISGGVLYTSINGDFTGTKLAYNDYIPFSGPTDFYFIPKTTPAFGFHLSLSLEFPSFSLSLGFLRSEHNGSWSEHRGVLQRTYLEGNDIYENKMINIDYNKIFFDFKYNFKVTNSFIVKPIISLARESILLENVIIDKIITSDDSYKTYKIDGYNQNLNSLLSFDLGLEFSYFITRSISIYLSSRYTVYGNLLNSDLIDVFPGGVIDGDGNKEDDLISNSLNIFIGFQFLLNNS